MNIPEGADIVFVNLAEGDEDFFSEQCGHLNISMAYRELRKVDAPIVNVKVPLADIPTYRKLRDVDVAHVERLKAEWPAPKERPVLLAELTPGNFTLVDGVHRLMASAEMEPTVDPIQLKAHVVTHRCVPLIQIQVYFLFPDGRKELVDTAEYMDEVWGKYSPPKPRR